uniref:B30.2/SPRY domain-containing protein n=1 Tax=Astyanax mexicanus TaxID=7994 RepID=A0A8B9RGE5_ASTMX
MDSGDWNNVSQTTSLTLLVENVATKCATHSVPWNKPMLSNKKPVLKPMQALDECVQLIKDMAKELEDLGDLSKVRKRSLKERDKDVLGKSDKPTSMDHSKSLIQSWAKEVNSLNLSSRLKKTIQDVPLSLKDSDRILEWARELQSVSESLGLKDEDLKQILSHHRTKQTKLNEILPFLEFVVWSLVSQQSEEDISNIWLSVKQRQWKTGSQKYIPRSVWQWIQSASADVQLDPSSCHPWLCVSEDRQEVRECNWSAYQKENHDKELSCVLGLNSFSTGRHYWEVLVPRHGSWKLGVVSASAPRTGIFPINPETGYWCIWKGPKNLWACTDPKTSLQLCLQSQVVGVFLDYEEGQVSFYDVSRSFHIYTFTQIFKEALFPVFVCLDGTVLKVQTAQISGNEQKQEN